MSHPLISVIMPVYNGEKYIRETIDSVLGQTCRNFEFIIVNDGSTDSTPQIIDSYADPRIVLIDQKSNQGVSNARNLGTQFSRGGFIAFCDADDVYSAERLSAQLDFLTKNPNVDVCGSYFTVFENGQEILIEHPTTDQTIKEYFFTGNCIGQPSVMGKSEVFRDYPYNPALQASEDYDLWARMAVGGIIFANIPLPLVKYRLHPAQASKTKGKLLDITSKAVSKQYALAYLNNDLISRYEKAKITNIVEFKKFVEEISSACEKMNSANINKFRPLIAQQYKKIDHLGIRSFVALRSLESSYHITFPTKYLFNIFLLSFIRINKSSSLFDTLTKLKL